MTTELLNKLEAEKKAANTARVLPNKTDIAAMGKIYEFTSYKVINSTCVYVSFCSKIHPKWLNCMS